MQTIITLGRVYEYSQTIGNWRTDGDDGFYLPVDVAISKERNLYVLSRGDEYMGKPRVTVLTMEEEFLWECGSGGTGDGQFVWPSGLALDSEGNVYVSDDWLHRITVFDSKGNFRNKWGIQGSGDGQLNAPSGLVFDGENNLYISDTQNNRVQKFTREGQFLLKWGRSGRAEGEFNLPWGIAIDNEGNLLVADWGNHRVQKFSPEGDFLSALGTPGPLAEDFLHHGLPLDRILGFSRGATDVSPGELYGPSDVAVDKDGDIYVVDWGNDRVHVFTVDGSPVTCFIGDAEPLSKWAQRRINDNPMHLLTRKRAKNPELQWRFARPTAMAVDDRGRIYITDTLRFRLQIYQKQEGYEDPQFNL